MKLNTDQLTDLRSIAFATEGRSAKLAQNILCFGYSECDFGTPSQELRKRARRVYDFENKSALSSLELAEEIELDVFPNPTKESISLKLANFMDNATYEIQLREITGKLLITERMRYQEQSINLNQLAKGSYLMILIKDGAQVAQEMIIKQ